MLLDSAHPVPNKYVCPLPNQHVRGLYDVQLLVVQFQISTARDTIPAIRREEGFFELGHPLSLPVRHDIDILQVLSALGSSYLSHSLDYVLDARETRFSISPRSLFRELALWTAGWSRKLVRDPRQLVEPCES